MTWMDWMMSDRGHVIRLMKKMHTRGGFMSRLADALSVADSLNTKTILGAWRTEFEWLHPMGEEDEEAA